MNDSHEKITEKEISDEVINPESSILKESEKSEEDIIMITNSCLDNQSFFIENKETQLTKLTRDIVSNISRFKQSPNKNLDYDDLIFLQKSVPTTSELIKNKKIANDFIKRNNYSKNKKNEENENKNNDNNFENEYNEENNLRKSNIKNNKTILSFLEREKRFEIKKNANKEIKLKKKDTELLNDIQEKPIIDKKSSKIALKNNRNTKAYNRLYKNPNLLAFSLDNEKIKSKENKFINIKTNNNNNMQNINPAKSQDLTAKKNNSNQKNNIKEMKSLSSNDFYKKDSSKNEDDNSKNEDKMFLTRNNSKIGNRKNKTTNKIKNKIIKNDKDRLFNIYNSQTAIDKMKILQINKINSEIDNLLTRGNINTNDTNNIGINFFLFCDLLFQLGFVGILHKKININELNEEYIKELEILPHLNNKSLITKDFILNEINLMKDAFYSIINNFKIIKNVINYNIDELLLNNNSMITIENFKLFIFILSDLFTGVENDKKINSPRVSINNIKTKNTNSNISSYSSKTNKSVNINSKKINSLISKLVYNKKLDIFTNKDISNYKNYFKYMIDINNENKIYISYLKKEIKKEKIEQSLSVPFTFIPKVNNNNDFILNSIKPNMNFEERNEITSKKKSKHKKDIQNQLEKEYNQDHPFSPKLNGRESIKYLKKMKEKTEKEKINKNKNNINVIKQNEENNKTIEINDLLTLSFKPNLNKPLKQEMFTQSPLANDKLLNEKIIKMRKTNFSNKLNNYEKNNREILRSDVKKDKNLLNYFLNNMNEGRMILGFEKQSNKDTFDIFIKQKKQIDEEQNKNNVADILNSKKKYPLFVMEIKIKNENNILEVFPNDNYEKLCLNFCKKNKLGEESYNQILELIKNKINEINGYSV